MELRQQYTDSEIKASASAVQYVLTLTGDPHPLIYALGPRPQKSCYQLTRISIPQVNDLSSLRQFVEWYAEEVLIKAEAPAIVQAAEYQRHYCPRELIELDKRLCSVPPLIQFQNASHTIGRSQLRRLLPMRDQKIVRIYYQAVQSGNAVGWHFLVYGLVLGLFYIPYRQGLVAYAKQTCRQFLIVGASRLGLPGDEVRQLEHEAVEKIVERLRQAPFPGIQAVSLD